MQKISCSQRGKDLLQHLVRELVHLLPAHVNAETQHARSLSVVAGVLVDLQMCVDMHFATRERYHALQLGVTSFESYFSNIAKVNRINRNRS